MIRPLVIGVLTGMRSLSPLAVVSAGLRRMGAPGTPVLNLIARPMVSRVLTTLAAAEAVGDKWRGAPDRIVAPGIAARMVTGALAGAALAPRHRRGSAAVLAAGAAVGAAYLTFALRRRATAKWGQTATGLAEDALTFLAARWIAGRPPK